VLHAQTLVATVEAETGTMNGVYTATTVPGFSGSSYVTGFDNANDQLTITVNVPSKTFYKMFIRYNATSGYKQQDIYVNGNFLSNLAFPAVANYADLNAGSILLNSGTNTITIKSSWGWTDFDRFRFYTVAPHDYSKVVPSPIDPLATQATKDLYSYLRSQYGSKIISGQTTDYYDNVTTLANGLKPVVRAYDFQNYSPMNPWGWNNGPAWGAFEDGTTNNAINWYNSTNKKGIVTIQWHWLSPSGGNLQTSTFYSNQTTFDVSQAVIPNTTQYNEVIRDIDAIAIQLKKLRDANVPVLWRPLHEAGGAWFWWGAKGPAAAKALYDIMYNRITHYHGIHNLIWVWSTPEPDWYPGNNNVDIIGYDSYPGAYNYTSQKLIFDQLYDIVNGDKMVALTENGPIPDINECFAYDAIWSYYMSWSDLVASQNTTSHIQTVFADARVITLNEVALSVDFISLSYQKNSSELLLLWNAHVYDTGTFTIETSENGIEFQPISTLIAIPGKQEYQASLSANNVHYFRIRYDAQDEPSKYSSIIPINEGGEIIITSKNNSISVLNPSHFNEEISIFTLDGKLIHKENVNGNMELKIPTSGLVMIHLSKSNKTIKLLVD
jgi:mannan endo-1,4-beta-mannosidase